MVEKEYIERGAALAVIAYNPIEKPTEPDIVELTLLTAQKQIRKIPAADVVEVRHGEWIEHIEPDWLEDYVEVFYNCSECGSSHWSIAPPYCPNCGAKMDGIRKEQK